MRADCTKPPGGKVIWASLRWLGIAAVVVVGVALLAAACGSSPSSPGVANVGSGTPGPGASASGSSSGSELKFSECMRAHGIKDFPDPNAQGQRDLGHIGPNSDLSPNNPQFQAAHRACQSLLPQPSATQATQVRANALEYSACMRAHGIKDFPDPTFQNGGFSIIVHGEPADEDPNNPLFQAAQQACQHYLATAQRLQSGGQ
jgi:hypothetical protein